MAKDKDDKTDEEIKEQREREALKGKVPGPSSGG